jgi:hypothetical protein
LKTAVQIINVVLLKSEAFPIAAPVARKTRNTNLQEFFVLAGILKEIAVAVQPTICGRVSSPYQQGRSRVNNERNLRVSAKKNAPTPNPFLGRER